MNKEKFKRFAENAKQKVKEYGPRALIASAPAIALISIGIYAYRSNSNLLGKLTAPDDSVEFVNSNGDASIIMSTEAFGEMLEDPSKFCYKFDKDHHYSLAPNDCVEEH